MTDEIIINDDKCESVIGFYGLQFKRKPPEKPLKSFDLGNLVVIDLWNWTQGT